MKKGADLEMKKARIDKIIIYIVLIVFALIMIVPFLWMILTAFKTTAETMQVDPFVLVPKVWQVENFGKVVAAMDFVKLYANTILMIALRVLCAVLTATLSGYAFARMNFKGKNFMFAIVLFQMMIPVQIFIIPQYVMVSKLHNYEYSAGSAVSGTGHSVWYIPATAGIHGTSEGSGGGGTVGRM